MRRGTNVSYDPNNETVGDTHDKNDNDLAFGSYDAEDNLIQSSVFGTSGYTGDGKRAWRNSSGTATYFLYDGDQIVNEIDGSGNVLWSYGVGADGLAQASNSFSFYINYLFDPGGSVTQRQASTSSAPTDVQVYDAFGYRQAVSTVSSPRTNDPIGYKGQWGASTEQAGPRPPRPSWAYVLEPGRPSTK